MVSIEETIKSCLATMSVKEKALAVTGVSMFKLPGNEKLGIPELYLLDGGTGLNYAQMMTDCFYRINQTGKDGWDEMIFDVSGISDRMLRKQELVLGNADDIREEEKAEFKVVKHKMETEYASSEELPGCFPPGILLGSGWDEASVYDTGYAVGKEADFYSVDVLLGSPNVNIHRDPLNGRLFEGYSEDPYLCGKLAPEFVKGVQKNGIAANVKHFAANNQETDRRTVNEHISERALREIYLPGFQKCVTNGKCKTVMSAYNLINGTPCSMNKWLLTDVLRNEWGFDGFVVCDWGGAYKQVEALAAGNDADMPGPRKVDVIVEAVENGTLQESVLDIAITRIWKTILTLPCCMEGHKTKKLDRECSKKAAYNSVKEGMVLLKNEAHVLPLSKESRVSILGEKSKKLIESGGGSAGIITDQSSDIFTSVRNTIGEANVEFGVVSDDTDAIIVTVGAKGQEGFDRKNMDIDSGDKISIVKAISEGKRLDKPVIAILNTCGPLNLMEYIDDLSAVLCIFIPGMEGGHACADALFGDINPSGKLPLTFPKYYRDAPTSHNFPGWNEEVWYGEDILVGYRYYDFHNVEPLYPFGYGLSYAEFEITDIEISSKELELSTNDSLMVSVSVKNKGAVKGKEVVQLYIGEDSPAMLKPIKELKRFKKVELEPGETVRVSFELQEEDFASYDTKVSAWSAEPGLYHLFLGNSSRNIEQKIDINLTGYNPYGFNENTVMGSIAATEGATEVFSSFCPKKTFSKAAIEASILYQPSGSLRDYWKSRIEPLLEGTDEEKEAIYQNMLLAMNKFK